MPETYGLPEPEEPRIDRAERMFNETVAGASVVRTTLLWVLLFAAIISPFPLLAVVPAALLLATDPRMA